MDFLLAGLGPKLIAGVIFLATVLAYLWKTKRDSHNEGMRAQQQLDHEQTEKDKAKANEVRNEIASTPAATVSVGLSRWNRD